MKEHIQELAKEYSKSLMYEEGEQYTTEELEVQVHNNIQLISNNSNIIANIDKILG